MATTLKIIPSPTYTKYTLGIGDASTYDVAPASASLEITPPGFNAVDIPFTINSVNTYQSSDLEIVGVGDDEVALPDGVYKFVYSIDPAAAGPITTYMMRIEQIQERFDAAFMKLDMMECDRAIKKQSKVDLTTIYFFIQGAVSAANNCAIDEANKLYITANKMLDGFIRTNCGCSGSNYLINFS